MQTNTERSAEAIFAQLAKERLIACAPEMLEVLKELVKCWEESEDFENEFSIEKVRTLIAKATG